MIMNLVNNQQISLKPIFKKKFGVVQATRHMGVLHIIQQYKIK